MFYLVGLGLFDEKDISLKGLECLKNVDKIYAEFFTSRLFGSSFDKIEELIGKDIEIDAVRLINDDIASILVDLKIETFDKIMSIK